jgi:stage V sporulation protein AD
MRGYDLEGKLQDCGLLIYDREKQDVHAGGSGCGCVAGVFTAWVLNKMREGLYQQILFLATGALMSPTSSQQGETIPAVAHAAVISAG